MNDAPVSRLKYYPVTFFAIVMGLLGLTLALYSAGRILPVAEVASGVMLWVSMAAFALIGMVYFAKLLRYPGAVIEEWQHPVKLAFFPTMTISLLLLAAALQGSQPELAEWVWLVGVAGQGVLTIAVVSGWISHRSFEVGHLTPAWFIPAVGNVVVPIAGARMGYIEISWLFFSGGMMFWGILLTMVMNRLVFHDPMPGRLFPTMVILIAPPSVAFVAYVGMNGVIDGFARTLIYSAYIFAALVVVQLPKLVRLPFALSWWALSFPLAALSIASFLFARLEDSAPHRIIGLWVLAVLILVVIALTLRTAVAIWRDEICRPD